MIASPESVSLPAPRSCVMGIDPGLMGAFALYDPNSERLLGTWKMPTVKTGRSKRHDSKSKSSMKVDAVGLGELIGKLAPLTKIAVIELVGAMPSQGVVSMFNFGMYTGMIHGALGAYQIPTHLIRPGVWKMLLGVTSDKKTALNLATKYFPEFKSQWPNAAQSGHAEAAILSRFGTRFLEQKPHDREDGQQLSEFAKDLLG